MTCGPNGQRWVPALVRSWGGECCHLVKWQWFFDGGWSQRAPEIHGIYKKCNFEISRGNPREKWHWRNLRGIWIIIFSFDSMDPLTLFAFPRPCWPYPEGFLLRKYLKYYSWWIGSLSGLSGASCVLLSLFLSFFLFQQSKDSYTVKGIAERNFQLLFFGFLLLGTRCASVLPCAPLALPPCGFFYTCCFGLLWICLCCA